MTLICFHKMFLFINNYILNKKYIYIFCIIQCIIVPPTYLSFFFVFFFNIIKKIKHYVVKWCLSYYNSWTNSESSQKNLSI